MKNIFFVILCFFFVHSKAQDPFVTTWSVLSNDLSIIIPTVGEGYDYTIDFGDGTVQSNVTGNISHTYDSEGVYTVSITGDFPHIKFNEASDENRRKLLSIE